jgi:O-antigen/teichoic acid export membrane protein
MLLELFGPTYQNSYLCLLILCFGQLINILTGCNGSYLIVTGQGKLLMKATIIGGLLSISLMAILGTLWALEGVAIGYAVGVAFVGIYCAHKIYLQDGIKTWVGGTFNVSKLLRIVALK